MYLELHFLWQGNVWPSHNLKNLVIELFGDAIVHIISQCNQIFSDIIFTFYPIKLNLTSIISTF